MLAEDEVARAVSRLPGTATVSAAPSAPELRLAGYRGPTTDPPAKWIGPRAPLKRVGATAGIVLRWIEEADERG